MAKPVFEIDGKTFDSLDGFFEEVGRMLIPGAAWGANLDAFDDILGGGFGTPSDGFILRWSNSSHSQRALGYAATIRHLENRLRRCHPDNVSVVKKDLEAARRGEGQTLFDVLIEIIRRHGPGGERGSDGVELECA